MTPTLFANGRIWTGNPDLPWASNFAIENGIVRALDVDTSTDDPIDLGGHLVVPGWWDSHAHLLYTGASMAEVQLKGTRSIEEIQARVAARVERERPGAWIRGSGWDQNDWPDRSFPARQHLDAVAPGHPVFLIHTSGHCAWANSKALELAGVTGTSGVPPGGTLPLDADGKPTGMLFDRATDLVTSTIPEGGRPERAVSLRRAIDHAHSLGIVGVHAMDVGRGELAALHDLHARAELELRVRVYLSARDESLWEGHKTGEGDGWLAIGGVKWFGDGALGSLTAWMDEPYEGTGDCGFPLQPVAELEASVRRALEAGLAPAIHAIGDRANREVLAVLARTAGFGPGLPRRIEHAQLLSDGLVEQFAALGVTASVQPIHCTQDMAKVDREWGARGRHAYAFRSLLDAGVNLAFGSDTPVETMDPLAGIHAAVTRQRQDGSPLDGWYPGERVTVEDALTAYSAGAARATGEDQALGCIAPGFAADCVVLSHDIVHEPESLLEAKVEMTMVGGNVVYARPGSGFEACLPGKD